MSGVHLSAGYKKPAGHAVKKKLITSNELVKIFSQFASHAGESRKHPRRRHYKESEIEGCFCNPLQRCKLSQISCSALRLRERETKKQKMRECELCGGLRARIHCEADQANLCWGCDQKVHGANFLVAKHPRSLLCHGCQSPTPWMGSGPKLTPTVSVCEICVERRGIKFQLPEDLESEVENEDDIDLDDDDDDGGGGEDVDEKDEYQVVPWSCSHSAAAERLPAVSCTSSEEEEEEELLVVSKRMRENADPDSDLGCDETSSLASLRLLKRARLGEENRLLSQRSSAAELTSTAIVSSIQSLQNQADVITDGDDMRPPRSSGFSNAKEMVRAVDINSF